MTVLPNVCAILFFLPLAPLLDSGGSVYGSIINDLTGEALGGATIEIRGASGQHTVVSSNLDGTFLLRDLPPGEYRIAIEKPGFAPFEKGSLRVPDSQANDKTYRFGLRPWCLVAGRLVGEDGSPISGAVVELIHELGGGWVSVTTNQHGGFTFDRISPGRYYLRATPTDGNPAKSIQFTPTFYPAAVDESQAVPLVIDKGVRFEGYVIRALEKSHFALRGCVLRFRDQPAPHAVVRLARRIQRSGARYGSIVKTEPPLQVTADANGEFEFPEVPPGNWWAAAAAATGQPEERAVLSLLMPRGDLSSVRLRLAPPLDLEVVTEFQQIDPSAPTPEYVAVMLLPADGAPVPPGVVGGQPGERLKLSNLALGRYRIVPRLYSSRFYLDTILIDGGAIPGYVGELGQDGALMKLVFKDDGGSIGGSVDGCSGGVVVALPSEPGRLTPSEVHVTGCGASGAFNISNLRPGAYLVLAFDDIPNPNALSDPMFASIAGASATTVHVQRQTGSVVQLRVSPWPE